MNKESLKLNSLRCEYRVDPLGIDTLTPRLSWVIESGGRSVIQSAYQILVASTPELLVKELGDLWDSGKVVSDRQNQVEYNGQALMSRMRCHWKVRVWIAHPDKGGDQKVNISPWSETSLWTMGLLHSLDWQAQWIGLDEPLAEGALATPRHLRREFTITRPLRHATVYATALGLYELRLNGQRVGKHLLAPEWTNYHKRVQYQTYEVTGLLRRGVNAFGAILGNGWYCGDWQFWQKKLKPIYGTDPYFCLQLEMEFADGERQTIGTDSSWSGTTKGPIRFSGIYEGETYDARLEMPGWDEPDFDAGAWSPVTVNKPGTDFKVGQLVWQRNEPICIAEELKPVAVTEPKAGIYVVDFGQNIGGWCRLRLNAPGGTQITLMHNEVLNPDGTVYMDNLHAGHLCQGDRQIDRYICRGGCEEVFEPHFTCHGFRYVEIHGFPEKPEICEATGVVIHSSFRKTGEFTCSNPLINRLVENIQWSQRGNMMGIPTDCNQRDERCGYTGDANFFMPAAVYNFDIAAFFNKWLVDVCQDSQMPEGWFADHAPYYGPGSSPNVGWSEAGVICPHSIYREYGDTRIICEHYEAMKRAIEHLSATANSDGTRGPEMVGNGDWLNLGGGASNEVIGTAHYYYVFKIMAEMAEAIGKHHDSTIFQECALRVATAFRNVLVDAKGLIKDSSQTGYALAFTMGLVPDALKERMTARFVDEIERFNGHLATGFIGTPRLLPGLHLAGRDDLAYKLLLNETYPSWLFQVKNGATSMWERWDGWHPEKGFADSGMNSFNHYAFGACGAYFFSVIGGISPETPGYSKIRIQPVIQEGLNWANASYDSIIGRITTSWKVGTDKLELEIGIPANATATVYIPAKNASQVTERGKVAVEAEGVKFLRMEDNAAVFAVGSGNYKFRTELVHYLG